MEKTTEHEMASRDWNVEACKTRILHRVKVIHYIYVRRKWGNLGIHFGSILPLGLDRQARSQCRGRRRTFNAVSISPAALAPRANWLQV